MTLLDVAFSGIPVSDSGAGCGGGFGAGGGGGFGTAACPAGGTWLLVAAARLQVGAAGRPTALAAAACGCCGMSDLAIGVGLSVELGPVPVADLTAVGDVMVFVEAWVGICGVFFGCGR